MSNRFDSRVVLTGVGLTSPIGNDLGTYRKNLLEGRSGVRLLEVRHMGELPAGVCDFEATKHQTRKELRIGTRAGSIGIYCTHEALANAGLSMDNLNPARVGVYVGTTEHGNVETENEIHNLSQYDNDVRYWSHHHNPRTIANNPAGEITVNLGITGPHYAIGAACAAGNAGVIQGTQMLRLGEVDLAIAGGVSESIHTFGIFAGFRSQGALAKHDDPAKASRPFDKERNGIVVSEGGCLFVLERLDDALARGAPVLGEVAGYCMNSDGTDNVLPNPERQAECVRGALERAGISASEIGLVSSHATATPQGDIQECDALGKVFGGTDGVLVNNTKSFIGHAMGAAGALELVGNIPSFEDGVAHPTINLDELDPECALPGLVINEPRETDGIELILNNSFGMLGINSVLILKKFKG